MLRFVSRAALYMLLEYLLCLTVIAVCFVQNISLPRYSMGLTLIRGVLYCDIVT